MCSGIFENGESKSRTSKKYLLCTSSFSFMSPPTDPSITLTNLTQLLGDVENSCLDRVGAFIDIPNSVRDSNEEQDSNVPKAWWEWYLNNHPSPSWRHVASALYWSEQQEVLEELKSRYLKGWSQSYISFMSIIHLTLSVSLCACVHFAMYSTCSLVCVHNLTCLNLYFQVPPSHVDCIMRL